MNPPEGEREAEPGCPGGDRPPAAECEAARILVVEDDRGGRELLVELLEGDGYRVDAGATGEEGLAVLRAHPDRYDAVLLDWMLPGLDGLEVLRRIKHEPHLQMIPVILQTARAERRDLLEGLAAGAYYYLTKPLDADMVRSTVAVAVRDYARCRSLHGTLRRGVQSIAALRKASLVIHSLAEVPGLATLLSHLSDEPEAAAVGIGELLINAIEHGNLGITYEEKSVLLDADRWEAEVARRAELPENADKKVTIRVRRAGDRVVLEIRDEGPGFPWNEFLTIAPERAFDPHGRGIAMARMMSFESLEYRAPGNVVTAVLRSSSREKVQENTTEG